MPTLPKQDRPAREGARVASVETGLAAAAAKLAQQVSLERMHISLRSMLQVKNTEEKESWCGFFFFLFFFVII